MQNGIRAARRLRGLPPSGVPGRYGFAAAGACGGRAPLTETEEAPS